MFIAPRAASSNNFRTLKDANFPSFDTLFKSVAELGEEFDPTAKKYPPYNIIEVEEGKKWELEIAVAGFKKSELKVTHDETALYVEGTQVHNTSDTPKKYLNKGIASRNFKNKFTMNSGTAVGDARIEDGILRISLTRKDEAVKTVEINID